MDTHTGPSSLSTRPSSSSIVGVMGTLVGNNKPNDDKLLLCCRTHDVGVLLFNDVFTGVVKICK